MQQFMLLGKKNKTLAAIIIQTSEKSKDKKKKKEEELKLVSFLAENIVLTWDTITFTTTLIEKIGCQGL